MTNASEQFREAMRAAGLVPPQVIEADGKLRRFSTRSKRNDDSGWYVLHDDGIPAGSFGDWRSGLSQNWRMDIDRPLTTAEQAAHRTKVEAMRRERDAEELRGNEAAAAQAAMLFHVASPATEDHPYLKRKGVRPYGAKVGADDYLLIPMRDADGKLWNVERIAPEKPADGSPGKKGLFRGRRTGLYCAIGTMKNATALCICEGFATGVSIHDATGHPVAVAFNAGNLIHVAQAMREKFPELTLMLCADDDCRTEGNPGKTKATEAARAVGGLLALPDFGDDLPDGATDFNDLALLRGHEGVRQSVANAVALDSGDLQSGSDHEPADVVEAVVMRLSAMSDVDYDRVRKDEANALGIRVALLDKLITQARRNEEKPSIDFDDVAPWPHPVEPPELLTDLSATVRRFIVCKKETADTVALWAAMTWLMDSVQIAPLAVITAPEKRCGKSQLLFLLGRLSYRPLTASNISPSALFRSIDAWKPTLLVDEADAFMRDNEELRGLMNCGHTRDSAYIIRTVGEDFIPTKFNVWGAKALAGIGHLADTLMDRAITLELRRKLPHENVDRLRYAEPGLFGDLSAKLARFALDNADAVRRARPHLPESLNDRAQDNWEPLLAIADVAGGNWPEIGRRAALALSGSDSATMTVGTELLADIKELFEIRRIDRITTADLIGALTDDDEKPWLTYNRGKPISPRQVARKLSDFDIKSKNVRIGIVQAKGFSLEQFQEAFSRYLYTFPENPSHSSQTLEANNDVGFGGTGKSSRYGNENSPVPPRTAPNKAWDGGTDKKGGSSDVNKAKVEI